MGEKLNMNKNEIRKCLVLGMVVLFVGASITPTLSGHINQLKNERISSDLEHVDYKIEKNRNPSTEIFYPTDDALVSQIDPTTNEGYSQFIKIRRGGSGWEVDSLIKFDISSVPQGSTIENAKVHLYYNSVTNGDPTGRPINAHRILEDWDEGTVTWNNRPDHDPSISTFTIMPGSPGQWMQWNVTSDVQDFINNQIDNYGWKLIDPTPSGALPLIYFRSKEHTIPDTHPYLEIEYVAEEEPIGTNWFGNTNIVTNPSSSEEPVIQSDSMGNIHVVWHDDRDSNYEIYYKKLDNDGNELIGDTPLTSDDGIPSQYPSMGIDSEDNIHIVWQDFRDGNWQVYYTKLDNEGNTLVDDIRITDGADSSQYPILSISDLDNIHVAWQDNRDQNLEIYYKKLDNDGNSLSDEIRLTNTPDDSLYPDISLHHDRIAHVSWQDPTQGKNAIFYDDVFSDLLAMSLGYVSSDGTKPYLAQVGVPLNFTTKLMNIGDLSINDVTIEVVVDETPIWSTQLNITAGSTSNHTFSWTPSQQGWFDVLIRIDPDNDIDEFFEINNEIGIRLPIIDPINIYTTLFPGEYFDILMACERIEIDAGSILNLQNCDVIMYGSSEIFNHGGLIIQESILTTSHASDYISQFINYPDSIGLEITNSEISQLGGNGIDLQSTLTPPIISGNTITDSQNYAITCYAAPFAYNFDDNVIMRSGLYDFNIVNAQVHVADTYFDQEKVNLDGPSSALTYYRQIQCTVWDENDTLAEGVEVVIKDVNNNTVWSGYTNETGQIEPQLVPVFEMTGAKDMVVYFAPYHFDATCQQGFAGIDAPEDSMFGPLPPGNWELKLRDATRTKYAILFAGWDSPGQDTDRYAMWNEIEFMYQVLVQYKGYKAQNIKVFFLNGKDGTAYGGQLNGIINGAGNLTNFEAAIQDIGTKIKNDISHSDTLFIFTSDHGSDNYGGSLCTNDGPKINRSYFGQLLNTYIGKNASQIYVVMGQCYSGGFIPAVRDHRRVIITAAYYNEFSWWYSNETLDEHPFDGLSYFTNEFTSANYNKQPGVGNYVDTIIANNRYGYKNTTDWYQHYPFSNPYHNVTRGLLNLDDNNDGTISVHEAHDYAHDNDIVGRVNGKHSNTEISQEVDDDFIVMAGLAGKVLLYRYNGNTMFSGKTIDVGGELEKVFVRYIDSVNEDDIVVLDSASNKVKVLLNRGDFTFSITNYSVGVSPLGMWVGDLNGDGYHEIVTANKGDDDISVLFNSGFGTYLTRTDYIVGDGPGEVIAAQLDGINHADLIVLNENAKTFTVLFNNGGGGFPTKTHYSCSDGGTPSSVAITDVNNDTYNDIVITLYDKNKVEIWTNDGFGAFTSQGTVDTYSFPEFAYAVDLTYDGLKEIVIAHGTSAFWVYENCGNGTLNYTGVHYNFPGMGSAIGGIFANDIDGDEDFDLIVPTTGNHLTLFLNDDTDKQGKMSLTSYGCNIHTGMKIMSIHGTNHNKPRYWRL